MKYYLDMYVKSTMNIDFPNIRLKNLNLLCNLKIFQDII